MDSGCSSPMVQASGVSTPAMVGTQAKICVFCGASPGTKPEHMEMARSLARAMAANNIGLGMSKKEFSPSRRPGSVPLTKCLNVVYGGGTVGLMGEIAKTLVSLSGPDSVRGVIPAALVKYERDATYASTGTVAQNPLTTDTSEGKVNGSAAATGNGNAIHEPSPLRNAAAGGTEQQTNGTATDSESPGQAEDKGSSTESELPIPTESIYGRTTVVKDMHTRKALMAKLVMEGGPGSGFIAMSGGYGTMEELLETCTWNQLGIHDKPICVLNVGGFFDGLLGWIDKAVEEGFIRVANKGILAHAETAEEALRRLREYKVSDAVFKLQWGTQ